MKKRILSTILIAILISSVMPAQADSGSVSYAADACESQAGQEDEEKTSKTFAPGELLITDADPLSPGAAADTSLVEDIVPTYTVVGEEDRTADEVVLFGAAKSWVTQEEASLANASGSDASLMIEADGESLSDAEKITGEDDPLGDEAILDDDAIATLFCNAFANRTAVVTFCCATDELDEDFTVTQFQSWGKNKISDWELAAREKTTDEYVRWNRYKALGASPTDLVYHEDTGEYTVAFKMQFTFYLTDEEEEEYQELVEEALDSLYLDESDPVYTKVRTIYDYICKNVTYDKEGRTDGKEHTAYAALKWNTAVCQGYGVLLWDMLNRMGVAARCVVGLYTNKDGGHLWNIVEMGDSLYYYADSTWDAGVTTAYKYFLKGEDDFEGHTEYSTEKYASVFDGKILAENHIHNWVEPENVTLDCVDSIRVTITCDENESQGTRTYAPIGHDWDDGTETQAPTLLSTGIRTFTCIRCGDTREEDIAALDTVDAAYQVYMSDYQWMDTVKNGASAGSIGAAKRIERFKLTVSSDLFEGGVTYRVYRAGYGWNNWQKDGAVTGVAGKRAEAFQIALYGELADNYDIYYRVYTYGKGWSGWAKNGAAAGTTGYSLRAEDIQIRLVEKGDNAPGSTSNCYRHKAVKYRSYQTGKKWTSYYYDGATSGTGKNRTEAIQISLVDQEYTGSIRYRSYVYGSGWQSYKSNGATSGTTGKKKAINFIKVELTGDMAKHYQVKYRMYTNKNGWLSPVLDGTTTGKSGARMQAMRVVLVPVS